MGFLEVSDASYKIPGGRLLFDGISCRVGNGQRVALVGANGTGKTTLLKCIAGIEPLTAGQMRVEGRIGYMPQFFGPITVRELLIQLSGDRIRKAALELVGAEAAVESATDPRAHAAYADALTTWGEAGGYEEEVLWDICTHAAFGADYQASADRSMGTLSGGQQKRLALEFLLRGDSDVLLLDEPDNFLDIPGKEWLEDALNETRKTVFYVSHDRTLLANTSTAVVTIEAHGAWTHPDSFASYQEAREHRLDKIDEEHRRFIERRKQLYVSMLELKRRAALNSKNAARARAAETKLKRYEVDHAPREKTREQSINMKLRGGRTGKIAFRAKGLAIPGIFDAFEAEFYYGERVGVVGPNGSGKTHFLKLLSGADVAHTGEWKLGARVAPSLFSQTHERSELVGRSALEIMMAEGFDRGRAMSGLKRYELTPSADTPFEALSGGQQARLQILLMEHSSPTMLLLDEPTDNLDIDSAEALERGLDGFQGTVIAVTHDRWFMQLMDRFLVFESDGTVYESDDSPYL